MKYTTDEINHIIYNNRSYNGVVKNFFPKLTTNYLNLLLEIGDQVKFANKITNSDSSIIINPEDLDLTKSDIEIFPKDIENIKITSKNFSDEEKKLLDTKKISKYIIDKYGIFSLSAIKELKVLELLGVTTHPILKSLFGDGISDGLIIMPIYKNDKFINCVFRKIESSTKLKYGITVPSIDLWGLDDIEQDDEIWITEGLFDMIALKEQGKKCVSASSCSLNDFHYYQIIKKQPSLINIFTDNDTSGYRSAFKSQKVFSLNGIQTKIYSSEKCKDAAEHFFEKNYNWNFVKEIKITMDMINRSDELFDILLYLKNRQF